MVESEVFAEECSSPELCKMEEVEEEDKQDPMILASREKEQVRKVNSYS